MAIFWIRPNGGLGLGLGLLGAMVSPSTWAALGGDVASAQRDHQALHATPSVTPTVGYDLYQSQTSDGAELKEYVDRSGKVFAVSYRGVRRPDIGGLLGVHAARYQAAAQARRGGHHVLVINDPDLTVTIVHMSRGWSMHATLPGAIPSGVDRAEIP